MTSLRRTILGWTTALLTIVGLAGGVVSYWLARDEARGFLDGQLRQIALNAGGGLPAPAGPAVPHDDEDDFVIEIWNGVGEKVHTSHPAIDIPRQPTVGFADLDAAGHAWRVYTSSDGGRTVQVAQRESVRREIAQNAAVQAAAPILVVMPLAWIVIGWALSRFSRQLTELATSIAQRSLDSRDPIPLDGVPGEVSPLVGAMNSLIERLHHTLEQQRRFISDAAHELRTPLTALSLQIENLRRGTACPVADMHLTELEQGRRRASTLVDQLLRIARYDAAPTAGATESVDLLDLLKSCVAEDIVVAESKGVDLGLTETEDASVRGAKLELRVLFANLIDNAVRYTPHGGQVDVSIRRLDGHAVVEISDTGCGLPKDLVPRAFDRFFRAAPPDIEGNGLGLAIVKAVADRHGLTVQLTPREGGGLTARVSGPAV